MLVASLIAVVCLPVGCLIVLLWLFGARLWDAILFVMVPIILLLGYILVTA